MNRDGSATDLLCDLTVTLLWQLHSVTHFQRVRSDLEDKSSTLVAPLPLGVWGHQNGPFRLPGYLTDQKPTQLPFLLVLTSGVSGSLVYHRLWAQARSWTNPLHLRLRAVGETGIPSALAASAAARALTCRF